MFFFLSKALWLFVEPVNFSIGLSAFGVLLGLFRPWPGRALTSLGLALLAVMTFSPLGQLLIAPLEARFPKPAADMAAPYGIIVLGGAIDDLLTRAHGELALQEGASRLTEAALLARRYPGAKLFYTGGSSDPLGGDSGEAAEARDFWIGLGMAPERIAIETKSRNTDENARFSAEILRPTPDQNWLLVTSAFHMPRSMGLFRKAGFHVTAYPVDYRSFGDARDWSPWVFRLTELSLSDLAIHEWLGLASYRASGKIDALFPAP